MGSAANRAGQDPDQSGSFKQFRLERLQYVNMGKARLPLRGLEQSDEQGLIEPEILLGKLLEAGKALVKAQHTERELSRLAGSDVLTEQLKAVRHLVNVLAGEYCRISLQCKERLGE